MAPDPLTAADKERIRTTGASAKPQQRAEPTLRDLDEEQRRILADIMVLQRRVDQLSIPNLTTHGQPYHAWIPPGESQAASSKCDICNPPGPAFLAAVAEFRRSDTLAAATERLVQAALELYDKAVDQLGPGDTWTEAVNYRLHVTVMAYRQAQQEAQDG